jgi:hypothetical protein
VKVFNKVPFGRDENEFSLPAPEWREKNIPSPHNGAEGKKHSLSPARGEGQGEGKGVVQSEDK